MRYKPLGNTDVLIPEIGLGTWNYSGGVEPLRKGIEMGAILIDTAEGYGTEDIVGQAVAGIREKVFIATKVSGRHLAYDQVLKSAEDSLRRLKTSYIDLYQIHWPNPVYPIEDTMKAMERLVDEGIVRFVGVSNFSVEEFEEAQHYLPNYKIVSNQVLYSLNSRSVENDMLLYCGRNNITILAYTPLDSGRLCVESQQRVPRKYGVLMEIASRLSKTPAQVALNWCIKHKNVVAIPKSDSVERTIENCNASGWYLSDEDMELLDSVFC